MNNYTKINGLLTLDDTLSSSNSSNLSTKQNFTYTSVGVTDKQETDDILKFYTTGSDNSYIINMNNVSEFAHKKDVSDEEMSNFISMLRVIDVQDYETLEKIINVSYTTLSSKDKVRFQNNEEINNKGELYQVELSSTIKEAFEKYHNQVIKERDIEQEETDNIFRNDIIINNLSKDGLFKVVMDYGSSINTYGVEKYDNSDEDNAVFINTKITGLDAPFTIYNPKTSRFKIMNSESELDFYDNAEQQSEYFEGYKVNIIKNSDYNNTSKDTVFVMDYESSLSLFYSTCECSKDQYNVKKLPEETVVLDKVKNDVKKINGVAVFVVAVILLSVFCTYINASNVSIKELVKKFFVKIKEHLTSLRKFIISCVVILASILIILALKAILMIKLETLPIKINFFLIIIILVIVIIIFYVTTVKIVEFIATIRKVSFLKFIGSFIIITDNV